MIIQEILEHVDAAQNMLGAGMTACLVKDSDYARNSIAMAMLQLHKAVELIEKLPEKKPKCSPKTKK